MLYVFNLYIIVYICPTAHVKVNIKKYIPQLGAKIINQTYFVAFAPTVTGLVYMRRLKLFLGQCTVLYIGIHRYTKLLDF